MRRLFVLGLVALAVLMAFALVGCGGGGDEAAAPAATPAAAPPPAEAAAPAPADDRNPTETASYAPLPSDPSIVPTAVAQRVAAKQPMVIFFYDPTQRDTDEARAAVDAAVKPYRGLIDVVAFNVGKYINSSTGEIVVDPKLKADPAAFKTVQFAEATGVKFTPFVIITDQYGYTVARFRGPWDAKSLEQQVIKATQ